MTQNNLQQAAAQLDGNSEEIVNDVTGEITADILTVHCAVNHVPDGNNVLVRIKEFGTNSPTFKMLKSAFTEGGQPAVKGENFLATINNASLYQNGQYLQGGDACIVSRDGGGERAFDARAYMASLEATVDAQKEVAPPTGEESDSGAAFKTD